MYCMKCGNQLSEGAKFCEKCGASVAKQQEGTITQNQNGQAGNPYDAPSGGMAVLSFFFPIIGLILYLVWKDEKPLRAHSAGKGALIGVIIWVVLYILGAILPFAFLYSAF